MIQIFDYQYFGSVNYYSNLFKAQNPQIYTQNHWYKMGFLNRCWILGANGKLELTVPVVGGRNQNSLLSEVQIDYRESWQKKHIRAIVTSYSKSPFFEFYFPDVEKILETKFQFLWELNETILKITCAWLKHPAPNFLHQPLNLLQEEYSIQNFGNKFIPKKMGQFPTLATYNQVFMNKFGFVPSLSILDLLFCEGPLAKQILTLN